MRFFPPAGAAALALLALSACPSAGLKEGIFSKRGVRYSLGSVGPGWKQVNVDDSDVAFVAVGSEHSVAVDSTCSQADDAPLSVLTNHLLIGFTERTRISEVTEPMDGREALWSRYSAKLDGVPVELDLVVLKKDGCVYDFVYVAPPGRAEERRADFERVVKGFRTEPAS